MNTSDANSYPQAIDIDEFSTLMLSIPDIAWWRMASACGRQLVPVCKSIAETFSSDMERLMQLFCELEPICESDEELTDDVSPSGLLCVVTADRRACASSVVRKGTSIV